MTTEQEKMMEKMEKPEKLFATYLDGLYNITKFDGDDDTYSSAKWAEDIEDNAEIFEWTPRQTLIIARRSLAGTAALWLKTEKVFKSFKELKVALLQEFPEEINSKKMHEAMAAKKKEPGETYLQYMLKMKEMGRRARFTDNVAIQYIVQGIQDSEVNKTILYGAVTYPVLKERLKLYEQMKDRTEAKRSSTVKAISEWQGSRQPMTGAENQQTGGQRRRCYNCGENNHIASECPTGIKCFRCNSFGHLSKNCKVEVLQSSTRRDGADSSGSGGNAKVGGAGVLANKMTIRRFDQPNVKSKAAMFASDCQITATTNDEREFTNDNENENHGGMFHIQNNNNDEFKSKMQKKPMKMIEMCGFQVETLLDTGSCANLVADDQFKAFNIKTRDDNLVISGFGQTKVKSSGQFRANVTIDGELYEDVIFHVVPRDCMPFRVVLGQEFLSDVVMMLRDGEVKLCLKDDEWLESVKCFDNKIELTEQKIVEKQVEESIEKNIAQASAKLVPCTSLVTHPEESEILQQYCSSAAADMELNEKEEIEFCRDSNKDGEERSNQEDTDAIVRLPERKKIRLVMIFIWLISFFIHIIKEKIVKTLTHLFRKPNFDKIQEIHEENKKSCDTKKKSDKYELDEQVAIKITQFEPGLKLKPKFYGPYKVVKIKRNDRYDLEKLYRRAEEDVKLS